MRNMFHSALILAALSLSVSGAREAGAKDYGKAGATWQIAEPDLLEVIKARLLGLQKSGGLKDFEAKSIARAQESVRRPKPVAGITHASDTRKWLYDPTITIGEDIRDGRGHVIAAKGQKFNPLDHVAIPHDLAFIDGDSKAELAWLKQQPNSAKLTVILVNGSPIDRMKEMKRRLYFDQKGEITGKLGVEHTPAIARQVGKAMEITEYSINRSDDL